MYDVYVPLKWMKTHANKPPINYKFFLSQLSSIKSNPYLIIIMSNISISIVTILVQMQLLAVCSELSIANVFYSLLEDSDKG